MRSDRAIVIALWSLVAVAFLLMWSAATSNQWRRAWLIQGPRSPPRHLVFSFDDRLLAWQGDDEHISILSAYGDTKVHALAVPAGAVLTLHFQSHNQELVAIGTAARVLADGRLARRSYTRRWDIRDGRVYIDRARSGGHTSETITRAGTDDPRASPEADCFFVPIHRLGISLDAGRLRLVPEGEAEGRVLDAKTECATVSSDFRFLVTAGRAPSTQTLADLVIVKFWTLPDAKVRATLPARYEAVRSLAFSWDGRKLAVGREDGTVEIWHAPPGW